MVEIQDSALVRNHKTRSLLLVPTHDVYFRLTLIKIQDKLPSFDHLPLSSCIDISSMPPSFCSHKSLKMIFIWTKASAADLCSYTMHTLQHFKGLLIIYDDVN